MKFLMSRSMILFGLLLTSVFYTTISYAGCFELELKRLLALDDNDAERFRTAFLNNKEPLKDIEGTKRWIKYLIDNSLTDTETYKVLRNIQGVRSFNGNMVALREQLMKAPYNLGPSDAQDMAILIGNYYIRHSASRAAVWPAGRLQGHIMSVDLKHGTPYMKSGGHTYKGYENYLKEVYNPAHPDRPLKIVRIGAHSPLESEFKSGEILIQTLPNKVQRAYVPGQVLNSNGLKNVKASGMPGLPYFREAIDGKTEAYIGKSLFPENWTREDILKAQKQVLENPTRVDVDVKLTNVANFEGYYVKDGHNYKIMVSGRLIDDTYHVTTIFPMWDQ